MLTSSKPLARKAVVLREEFDNWAILFDPDIGNAFGLNPVSIFIWRLLDGHHSINDIVEELRDNFESIPEEAEEHIIDFIQALVELGLAEYETR